MKNNRLFIVFFLTIYVVFVFSIVKIFLVKFNIINFESFDNDQFYVNKEEKNIIDKIENVIGNKKVSLENKVNNSFPFYIKVNSFYYKMNYGMNKILYKNYIPIKKDSGEYRFFNNNEQFYYSELGYTPSELQKRVNEQVSFYNKLKDLDANIYIYIPLDYELTGFKKNNLNNYVKIFENNLDKDIKLAVMEVPDIDTYRKYFYKTDHHWNMNGALTGYYDIMNLMNKEKLQNLNVVEKDERKFYGSQAKKALNNQVYDYISDVDVFLDLDVTINGKKPDNLFKPRQIRLDREYIYYDYYVQYFNGQYENIIYDNRDDSKENLLIMSDSYAWQIDYLIASAFNKTHVVNLRYGNYAKGNFDLKKYIKDNKITNVLFLYDGLSTVFNSNNYNFEGTIK